MKVVKLSALHTSPLYPSGNIPNIHLHYWLCHSMAGSIKSTKIPVTCLGIEPTTFWLVAQHLNQLHHYMCLWNNVGIIKIPVALMHFIMMTKYKHFGMYATSPSTT
jgi:hypothetical protein